MLLPLDVAADDYLSRLWVVESLSFDSRCVADKNHFLALWLEGMSFVCWNVDPCTLSKGSQVGYSRLLRMECNVRSGAGQRPRRTCASKNVTSVSHQSVLGMRPSLRSVVIASSAVRLKRTATPFCCGAAAVVVWCWIPFWRRYDRYWEEVYSHPWSRRTLPPPRTDVSSRTRGGSVKIRRRR